MTVENALAALRAAQPNAWVSVDGLYRVYESTAAIVVGVKPRTLRGYREEGTGPAFHLIANRPTYALGDVLDWLETRRHDPRRSLAGSGSR